MSRTTTIDGTESVLDSRDIQERIEYLETFVDEDSTDDDDDDLDELRKLKAFMEEARSEGAVDLEYGATFIHEDYFVQYTKELIEDCYPEVMEILDRGTWPFNRLELDYECAALDAEADYACVDFDGANSYFVRNC